MTKEEKTLLLKDLCARLPYKVKCEVNYVTDESDVIIDIVKRIAFDNHLVYTDWLGRYSHIDDIKPYLRPMSSMTEEEKKIYNSFNRSTGHRKVWVNRIDYLISRHIDYRGLIPLGLALEAPKGMYKFN